MPPGGNNGGNGPTKAPAGYGPPMPPGNPGGNGPTTPPAGYGPPTAPGSNGGNAPMGPPAGYGPSGPPGGSTPGPNGPPPGTQPGGMQPPGTGGAGMQPPGFGGQGGPNQSPFSGSKGDGAEGVAQKFYDKIMAGDTKDMSGLFSTKATGKAKAFRDGQASEEMVSEMKTAMTNVRLSSNKLLQGMHVILLEENSGNQGVQPTGASGKRNQRKIGKRVQFQVVSEGGQFLIKDIRVL
ncbi:MAG TPA: hypothetical protein VG826_31980 [Pirellulales bacterium]|nr:hypothetical protein [Pirellulales bacterium]